MSRFSRYDTDEERLPDGMTRVGYDADTQVSTFQDSDGSYWESAPGSQYGNLTRVGGGGTVEYAEDTEPFLISEGAANSRTSWRHELMPLLNFGVIIGSFLLLIFWIITRGESPNKEPLVSCGDATSPYKIQDGDTCWSIGEESGISVDDLLKANPSIDCAKLGVGTEICVPS